MKELVRWFTSLIFLLLSIWANCKDLQEKDFVILGRKVDSDFIASITWKISAIPGPFLEVLKRLWF